MGRCHTHVCDDESRLLESMHRALWFCCLGRGSKMHVRLRDSARPIRLCHADPTGIRFRWVVGATPGRDGETRAAPTYPVIPIADQLSLSRETRKDRDFVCIKVHKYSIRAGQGAAPCRRAGRPAPWGPRGPEDRADRPLTLVLPCGGRAACGRAQASRRPRPDAPTILLGGMREHVHEPGTLVSPKTPRTTGTAPLLAHREEFQRVR